MGGEERALLEATCSLLCGYSNAMSSKKAYLDGLLEGHESPGVRFIYRFFMFGFVVLSLFSCVANIAVVTKEGAEKATVLVAVAILLLSGLALTFVSWYRADGLDPKFRRAFFFFIALIILLDVAACMEFARVINYQPPVAPPPTYSPEPTYEPTPSGPTHSATPAPPSTTNSSTALLRGRQQITELVLHRPPPTTRPAATGVPFFRLKRAESN
jgi:hypothetical protein